MSRFTILLSLAVLVAATSIALCERTEAAGPKAKTKSFVKKLGHFKVSLSEISSQPRNGRSWGEFGDKDDFYVDELQVWDDGNEVDVPESCFSDLAEVNEMKITPIKNGLVINISGSDAGDAYEAQIVEQDGQIVRRSVKDGEFPENRWEKTVYHENFDDIE